MLKFLHSNIDKEQNMDISDLYQSSLNWYEKEKIRAPIKVNKYKHQVENAKNELNEAISNNAPNYIINEYKKNLKENEYSLEAYKTELSLLRKPNEQDIEYRLHQREQFPKKLADILSHDDILCFHGTTIFGTKNILLSNTISSGADRFGRSTSFDGPGEISVTNKDTVETSIGIYMRLNDNYCYPAGCLFVLKAKDKVEYDKMPSKWTIKNVDLNKNPERLVAVITTPENIETVRDWAKDGGININKIVDFDTFIKNYQKQNNKETSPVIQHITEIKKQKD